MEFRDSCSCFFRYFFLIIILVLISSIVNSKETVKCGELYEIEVISISNDKEGKLVEKMVPATLNVRFAEKEGNLPDLTIEMPEPKDAVYIKINKDHLPPGFDGIMGNRKSFYFTTSNYLGPDFKLPLQKPQPGQILKESPETLAILDARGNPAEGFAVEFYTKVRNKTTRKFSSTLTKKEILDSSGIFHVPVIQSPYSQGTTNLIDHLNMKIKVVHPVNGQYVNFRFPRYIYKNTGKELISKLYLPMIRKTFDKNVPADRDVFVGDIVDHKANPVAFCNISPNAINLDSSKGFFYSNSSFSITANDSGHFEYVLPKDMIVKETGQEKIPKNASIDLNIIPSSDKDISAAKSIVQVFAKKNNRIVLPYAERLKFQFKDFNGNIIPDPFKDYNISSLTMKRTDIGTDNAKGLPCYKQYQQVSIRKAEDGIINTSSVFLPGEYDVTLKEINYLPQKLEKGAGENVIVWTPAKKRVKYSGMVRDIRTAKPVPGAYIILAADANAPFAFADMPDKDREKTFKNVPLDGSSVKPENNHIRLSNNTNLFSVSGLGRTNSKGEYSLFYPYGEVATQIIIWAPDMIPVKASAYLITGKNNVRDGEFQLPDAVMIPCGKVTAKILKPLTFPDEYLRDSNSRVPERINLTTVVSFEDNPGWKLSKPPLISIKDNPWKTVYSKNWNRVGKDFEVMVPSDVKFSVFCSNTNMRVIGNTNWKNVDPVLQGEEIELEEKEMVLNRPFIIKVLNTDKSSAPGKSVRIDGMIPRVTDDSGIVIGWTSGFIGRIEVMAGKGWEVLASKKNIKIPENDNAPVVEIILPKK